jgi:hypothetical protein
MPSYTINTLPQPNPPDPEDICDFLNETTDYDFEVEGCGTVVSWDICTWYEYDEDMAHLSEQYPGTIFVLDIQNERSSMLAERCYFRDGKMQCADITLSIEDFDESKLEYV